MHFYLYTSKLFYILDALLKIQTHSTAVMVLGMSNKCNVKVKPVAFFPKH